MYVVNCPVATSEAVAEHAMALMFALARELPRADAAMKADNWAKKDLMGIELDGKTSAFWASAISVAAPANMARNGYESPRL